MTQRESQEHQLSGSVRTTRPLGLTETTDSVQQASMGIVTSVDGRNDTRGKVNFIIEKNEGVFIDLLHYIDPHLFREYLDTLFDGGYYLTELNYQFIMDVLFDFRKLEKLREDIRVQGREPIIQIATGVKKMSQRRGELYRKPTISQDRKSVDYYFEPIYCEEQFEGRAFEKREALDIDEFVAAMWNYGIRFGLDMPSIRKHLNTDEKIRMNIAEQREPLEGKDAQIEQKISLEIKRGPKDTISNRTDYLQYEQGCVYVSKNTVIVRKKPGEIGTLGYTIFGDEIKPEDIVDIPLESLVGSGVRIESIGGYECIISNSSGFPRLEESLVTRGKIRKQAITKVHVDEKKVLKEDSMSLGKLSLEQEVVFEKDISLDIVAWKVTAKKDVETNIHAVSDILIQGNVIGVAQNTLISKEHQRVGAFMSKGYIVSENGAITVNGYSNNAYIEGKRGIITLKSASNSIIIGKKVEIIGNVFNSTIIADTIFLNGQTIGCKIIGKNISIKESTPKGDHENHVSVFYVDLSKKLEKQETLRKAMIVELQQLESSLDQEIIRKFAPLSKIETGKRLSLTRKIVEFMQDPHILVQDQYKAIYTSLKPILNQTRINWKKIFTLNNSISELTQEIEKNKKSMESNEKQPPKFTRKPGPVFSQFICYQESGELLDFTLDELRFFTTLFAGRDANTERYRLEKISI